MSWLSLPFAERPADYASDASGFSCVDPNEKAAEQTKECGRCHEVKPVSEFHQRKSRGEGHYTSYCKPCGSEYAASKPRKTYGETEQVIPSDRECSRCGEIKPISEFYKSKHQKTGHLSYCIPCVGDVGREKYLGDPEFRAKKDENSKQRYDEENGREKAYARFAKKKYGVPVEFIHATLEAQNNACANPGCEHPVSFNTFIGNRDRAVADHNHDTGVFRAVLCQGCNLALGHTDEDIKRLTGLVEYLNKHKLKEG